MSTNEDDNALHETQDHEDDATTDDDEDNLICEINHMPTTTGFAKPKQPMTLSWGKLTLPQLRNH